MIRKLLEILMAVVTSYGLSAAAGYVLYKYLTGARVEQLTVLVRLFVNPLIAVLTGALAGLLSKDNPVPPAVIGLIPWAMRLGSVHNLHSFLPSLVAFVPLILLAAVSAVSAFRCRRCTAWEGVN